MRSFAIFDYIVMKRFEVGKITQLVEDKSSKENVQKRNPIGFHLAEKREDFGKRLDKIGFSGELVEKEKSDKIEEKAGLKDDLIVRSEN